MEYVILVDESDHEIGTMEKMEAHRQGRLHRAFSILLFNAKRELLLQRRSINKYHSGGLWTNTCCSHPRPAEGIEQTVRRKLRHEMGVDAHPEFAYKFLYRANLDHNLIEYELDHVFVGHLEGTPKINREEVDEWRLATLKQVRKDMDKRPQEFTYWFRLIAYHPELSALVP